jgi:ribonuclease PH
MSQIQPIGYWEQNRDVYDSTRSNDEIRQTTHIDNKLTRSDGSVEVRHGNTILLCTINGPMTGDRSKQLNDKAYIELNLHMTPAQPSTIAHELMMTLYDNETYDIYLTRHLKELATHIIDVDLYPRAKIVVSFEIINHDGSLLTTCANALMQCIYNSGVAAKSTFLSFTIAKILFNDEILYKFDPTLADEAYSEGLLTMTIENPKFIHNFENGTSQDKVEYFMKILKSLQRKRNMDENDGEKNEQHVGQKAKYSKEQVLEMIDAVQQEPQIINFISQKQWSANQLQHAMGLIVTKWMELSAKLRE